MIQKRATTTSTPPTLAHARTKTVSATHAPENKTGPVVVDNDADDDHVCDQDEIVGCLDAIACNFNKFSTDYGDCEYIGPCDSCTGGDDGTGVLTDRDADDDGVCDDDEVTGCTDISACNYISTATEKDGCVYPVGCQTCSSEKTITFANVGSTAYTVEGVATPRSQSVRETSLRARRNRTPHVDIEGFVDVTTAPTHNSCTSVSTYWCTAHPVMRGTLHIISGRGRC